MTSRRQKPIDYATEGTGEWPDCDVDGGWVGEAAVAVAAAVRDAANVAGVRGLAKQAGISHTTILRVMNGQIWPTLATIAALEEALDEPVWPTRT